MRGGATAGSAVARAVWAMLRATWDEKSSSQLTRLGSREVERRLSGAGRMTTSNSPDNRDGCPKMVGDVRGISRGRRPRSGRRPFLNGTLVV